jgi:predicted HAD superfamily Cof-like phosphohydrolase
MSQFSQALVAFNQMYRLPVSDRPNFISTQRLRDLKVILQKELDEIDEVIDLAANAEEALDLQAPGALGDMFKALTALADLMGDIQVYCGSEMAKWGLPLDEVLAIIMESNMSKLGADGLPIYDANGKVQKGPNYWKPEPRIHALLVERLGMAQAG